jgi:hypothetical protein
VQFGDMTVGTCVHLDSQKFQPLSQFGCITFSSRQPVDVFGNDDIELVILCVCQHPREFRPAVHGRSGGGKIRVYHGDGPRVPIRKRSAQRDLIVDRTIPLSVGRKPGVNGGALTHGPGLFVLVHERQAGPTIFISDDGSCKCFDDLRHNRIKTGWPSWHFHTAAWCQCTLV